MKLNLIPLFAAIICTSAHAAVTIGTDDASNYGSGWEDGKGGNETFNDWRFWVDGENGDTGHFIGDSRYLVPDQSGANINSGDNSFGMYGHSGDKYANTARDFVGDTLGIGQTFSLDIAVNWRNGAKGFNLKDSDWNDIVNFSVAGDKYTVNGGTLFEGVGDNNGYADNTAFHLSFTQTTEEGGTWEIVRSGDINGTAASGIYEGKPVSIHFYIGGTGSEGNNNLYFNNLAVVPEPTTVLLGAIGSLLLLRRRR